MHLPLAPSAFPKMRFNGRICDSGVLFVVASFFSCLFDTLHRPTGSIRQTFPLPPSPPPSSRYQVGSTNKIVTDLQTASVRE